MKTYSMTKAEHKDLEHAQMLHVDYQKMSMMWRNEAGFIVESIFKRVGEDPEKLMKEGKRFNVDFDKGVIEVLDKPIEPAKPAEPVAPIVMTNGDTVKTEAPKEAVSEIK
jgi:hypothetical protein